MEQLLLHLWGVYILQSDWMAQNKTKDSGAAQVHAICYSLGFLLLRPSLLAIGFIFWTHFLIDRFRLARYVVWAKNLIGPKKMWSGPVGDASDDDCWVFWGRTPPLFRCPNGYPPSSPAWLSVWLLIIADNTLHLTLNYLALRYL